MSILSLFALIRKSLLLQFNIFWLLWQMYLLFLCYNYLHCEYILSISIFFTTTLNTAIGFTGGNLFRLCIKTRVTRHFWGFLVFFSFKESWTYNFNPILLTSRTQVELSGSEYCYRGIFALQGQLSTRKS